MQQFHININNQEEEHQVHVIHANINIEIISILQEIQNSCRKISNIVLVVRNVQQLEDIYNMLIQQKVVTKYKPMYLLNHHYCPQGCKHQKLDINQQEQKCRNYSQHIEQNNFKMSNLIQFCVNNQICPQQYSHYLIHQQKSIIIVQHELILDPKYSIINSVTDKQSVIVFCDIKLQQSCNQSYSMHSTFQQLNNIEKSLLQVLQNNNNDLQITCTNSVLNTPATPKNIFKRQFQNAANSFIIQEKYYSQLKYNYFGNNKITIEYFIKQILTIVKRFQQQYLRIHLQYIKDIDDLISVCNQKIQNCQIQIDILKLQKVNNVDLQQECDKSISDQNQEIQVRNDEIQSLNRQKTNNQIIDYHLNLYQIMQDLVKYNVDIQLMQQSVQLLHNLLHQQPHLIQNSQQLIQFCQFIQLLSTYSDYNLQYVRKQDESFQQYNYYDDCCFSGVMYFNCKQNDCSPSELQNDAKQQENDQVKQNGPTHQILYQYTRIDDKFVPPNNLTLEQRAEHQCKSALISVICSDFRVALKPVLEFFQQTIIVQSSDTQQICVKLQQQADRMAETHFHDYSLKLGKSNIRQYVITRGADQLSLTTKYEIAGQVPTVQNYAKLVATLCEQVQDGIVVAFPSFYFLQQFVKMLEVCKLLQTVTSSKLLFIQSNDPVEMLQVYDNYRLACDIGRGACIFTVANSPFLDQFDFKEQYCRLLLFVGIPFKHIQSYQVQAELMYQLRCKMDPVQYLNDQMKQQLSYYVAQLCGEQNAVVVYADFRFLQLLKQELTDGSIIEAEAGVERKIGAFMVENRYYKL